MSDLPMGRGFSVDTNFHGGMTFNFRSSEMDLSQKNVFNHQEKSQNDDHWRMIRLIFMINHATSVSV
ncbi:hypothetical protein DPMN_067833 [Dreissena polymorpha]|uniref:Uncharacterized protein n=1 Tax=Dreissena polymorpha TaxID=45954 RepID=A0A9D3YYL6_DREPO|nr:hypothetical protein DPMN_067833 [Dreissena polymorpha]